VPKNRLYLCTNCGMAPMSRDIALAKLQALAAGAALARKRYANGDVTVGWGSGRITRRKK
jgi:5-methyltetrahydropteroyltriglutamate--homocysteine methyltransferase